MTYIFITKSAEIFGMDLRGLDGEHGLMSSLQTISEKVILDGITNVNNNVLT